VFSLKHVLSFCLLLQVTTNNLIKFYSKVKRGLRTIVIFNEKVLKNEQVKSVKLFEKEKQRSKSLLFDEKEKKKEKLPEVKKSVADIIPTIDLTVTYIGKEKEHILCY
jgi:hypothetical protein